MTKLTLEEFQDFRHFLLAVSGSANVLATRLIGAGDGDEGLPAVRAYLLMLHVDANRALEYLVSVWPEKADE